MHVEGASVGITYYLLLDDLPVDFQYLLNFQYTKKRTSNITNNRIYTCKSTKGYQRSAAFWFLVLSKLVNSITRGTIVSVVEGEEELEELEEELVVESLIELVFEESLAEVESVVDSLLNFANALL